jgi:hypothetical protein
MTKYLRKYFLILPITSLLLVFLAVLNHFYPESSYFLNNKPQMTEPQAQNSNNQEFLQSSNEEYHPTHLHAQEFQFNASVKFPSAIVTNPDKYKESITHDKNGAFDIILTKQDDTIEYVFRISSVAERQCESDSTRACQQTSANRPAMGNVADIQITLKTNKLMPGIYQFGSGKSTPITDVMISSRQLYSDPAHGSLGCQTWGKGSLNIEKVVYDVNGKLEYLNASLLRVCDRTVPFSSAQLQNNVSEVEENIKQYTYYASWRCHLKLVKKWARNV